MNQMAKTVNFTWEGLHWERYWRWKYLCLSFCKNLSISLPICINLSKIPKWEGGR